jgi:hypothetical protein
MSSTIEQIDNYLKKNKKSLYTNLNKWYGEKKSNGSFVLDDDAKNLKRLWEDAQNAKGINNKIASFNALKEELEHWTNPEELAKQEAELEGYGLDNWPEFADSQELDKLRFFDQLSITPETNKLDDLNIDEIYSQGYDYEQMKALADQYGYDYTDKNDRAEFLKKVSEYQQTKDVEKIWSSEPLVDFMLPVSKEYARQNYQNIDGIGDMALPLAADVGINAAMLGGGGSIAGAPIKNVAAKQFVKNAVNNTAAPVIKGVANGLLNKEDFEDIVKDIVGETSTNIATPFLLKGGYRWATRPFQGGAKGQAAKDFINQKANAARDVQRKLKNGGVWQEFEMTGPDEIENVIYKTIRKENGRYVIKEISPEEYARNNNKITLKELNTFGEDSKLLRSKKTNAEEAVAADYAPSIEPAGEYLTEKKMRTASLQGSDPMSTLTSDELEVMGAKPKESLWNWAKGNIGEAPGTYLANAQGRTQYGNRMLGGISSIVPNSFVSEKTFEKKPKLTKADKAELDMLRRLYELNAKYPNMVKKPKLPEKYKEYGITLDDIFTNNP